MWQPPSFKDDTIADVPLRLLDDMDIKDFFETYGQLDDAVHELTDVDTTTMQPLADRHILQPIQTISLADELLGTSIRTSCDAR